MGESKDFGGAAFRRRTVVAAVARLACMLAWWGIGGWLSGPSACGAEPAGSAPPEGDALEEAVFRLGPLAEMRVNVEERMGHEQGQGFGARLAEAREKLEQGNEALQGERFAEAKAFYEGALAAAGWLQTNGTLRAEAREKRVSAAEVRRKALEEDGPHLGLTDWRQGEAAREAAMAAYESGDFAASGAAWDAAAEAYGRSGTIARAVRVEHGLEAAHGARRLGAWEEVFAVAGDVLELAPENPEARALQAEAEEQLKPGIRLKAMLDGREVEAMVTEGPVNTGGTTPVSVHLEGGGLYPFVLEYEEDGRRYVGRMTVEAMAHGRTDATVVLEKQEEPEAGDAKIITLPGGAAMEMLWCPPGRFTMGSPENETGRSNDETQHEVTLTEGFWMAKTEVTQEQWNSVMQTTLRQQRDKANPSGEIHGEGPDYPMYYVDWEDAREFCRRARLRLPTEAQWEYACRAGGYGPYGKPGPEGTGKSEDMGWFGEPVYGGGMAHPVAKKQPNAWGLYDMHGNIWEWCADRYTSDLGRGAATNPQGADSGEFRVLRGGSFWNPAQNCRSASRIRNMPDCRNRNFGFRPMAFQD